MKFFGKLTPDIIPINVTIHTPDHNSGTGEPGNDLSISPIARMPYLVAIPEEFKYGFIEEIMGIWEQSDPCQNAELKMV